MESRKLKNLIELGSKIAVYVPSTFSVSEKIDSTEKVEKTLEFLSGKFGGATSTKAIGSQLSNTEGLIKEQVTVCYSFTTSDVLENEIENVLNYCEKLKSDMEQEAISLEINNKLYLI